jgi:hypothetical protein
LCRWWPSAPWVLDIDSSAVGTVWPKT